MRAFGGLLGFGFQKECREEDPRARARKHDLFDGKLENCLLLCKDVLIKLVNMWLIWQIKKVIRLCF